MVNEGTVKMVNMPEATAAAGDQKRPTGTMTGLLSEGSAALKTMTSATVNGVSAPLPARNTDSPIPAPAEGVPLEQLWQELRELTAGESEEEAEPPALTALQRATALSHTCAVYTSLLEPMLQRMLTQQLETEVTDWLGELFSQPDMSLLIPPDGGDSLPAMVKMRLHATYASFAASGYEALYARPPVVYVSTACRQETVTNLMTSLGLPGSAIRQVATSTMFGSAHAMDVAQLQRMMEEDETAQKIPLVVLAHAGTPDLCHTDNLSRVAELCRGRGVWCHVTGPDLAALSLISPTNDANLQWGDSYSLDLGAWLDVPFLRPVTLFRASPAAPEASLPPAPSLQLLLPVWTALKTLGRAGLVEKIKSTYTLAAAVETRIAAIANIKLLSWQPGKEVSPVTDVDKLLSPPVNANMALESLPSAVVFQYKNDAIEDPVYLDNLNSWLGQIMQRDLPEVPIQLLDVDGVGFCLKFSPLTSPCRLLYADALDEWAQCLNQQIEILNATVHHRARFAELTRAGALRAVSLTNWAGLGAVRYIPAHLQPLMEAGVTDTGKADINKLNSELLNKLKSTDSAFSLGDGEDGMVCIRFGMVTMDTDVEELCSLLLELGGEIEESSRFLETMSEVVVKGIAEASQGIRKETEDRVWQEGMLRHVPLVGTFVNWWSPPPKDAVKGRKLDLAQGVIESTEETYKSHVQIRRESLTTGPAATSDGQRSRTPSTASAAASVNTATAASASTSPPAAPASGEAPPAPENPAEQAETPAGGATETEQTAHPPAV